MVRTLKTYFNNLEAKKIILKISFELSLYCAKHPNTKIMLHSTTVKKML